MEGKAIGDVRVMVNDFSRLRGEVVEDVEWELEVGVDGGPEIDDSVLVGAEADDDVDGKILERPQRDLDVAVRGLSVAGDDDERSLPGRPQLGLDDPDVRDDLADAGTERRPAERAGRDDRLGRRELLVAVAEAELDDLPAARGRVQETKLGRRAQVRRDGRVEPQRIAELVPTRRLHRPRRAVLRDQPFSVRSTHRPRVIDDPDSPREPRARGPKLLA
mmetsp:Transcript_11245/g.35674  ORF Transcript_11245/g.35674 Transcript_11245/m.35674 type:complete len:219 (+) Transcript_11245:495-1151(+)